MIFSTYKQKELMAISKMLGRMYRYGIPINSCLEVLIEVTSNKKYKESLIEILKDTNDGRSLSEGFKKFNNLYSPFFTGFISIGENTGKLYEVLNGLSMFYEKYTYLLNKIRNILFYPAFIFISIIILVFLMIQNIIPNFYEIYESLNIKMSDFCKFLYDINIEFNNHTTSSFLMMLSIIAFIVYILMIIFEKMKTKLYSRLKIFKQLIEYMSVLIFSIITSTGINISDALSFCKNSIKIKFLNEKIIDINNSIINGKTLTCALEESNILSKLSLALVRVSEESGTLDEGFKELSEMLEKDLFENIEKKINRINPCCMAILGFLVCIVLITIVVPLFDGLSKGIVI